MDNVFRGYAVGDRYDLKGSTQGRRLKVGKGKTRGYIKDLNDRSIPERTVALKYIDWLNFKKSISFPQADRN